MSSREREIEFPLENTVVGALANDSKSESLSSPVREKGNAPRSEIPNGGLVAWLQVSGSFILFFNSWGISNSFGAFENYYVRTQLSNRNASEIAWIGSIQSFLLLIIGVVTGPVFDQGYFRLLVILGSFLTVFGMMMTSLCKEYWQVILAQAVVTGLGSGCLFIPSVAVIPQYFTTKRSVATGIAASGSSLGGLQPQIGFGWATRVIAFIMLVTQAYVLAIMRVRTQSASKRKLFDASVFHDLPYMTFTVVVFFGFVGVYIPFYYMEGYAVHHGIFSEETAFYLLSLLNGGSIFGRIIPNFLADKIGPLNIFIPCAVLTVVVAFSWLSSTTAASVILVAFFYGFFSGSFVSLPPSVLVSLSPDMKMIGTRMGMSFAVAGLGLLIGTPIAGALLKTPAGYTATILFCGAAVAAGAIFVVMTRALKVGWVLKVKV
ncbi:major facilitator superfamily domain-containing protein [Lipomyces tetrasporus]|uniref:Major facilitator superfamily domain-containing protein n=1 Tax=Lipomyces tetrasporus TaxID=54092 RepID=A0AAD7QUU4_9ASCO|nr:major facilitator superfamily domain-containing protein [Lipomyces tetrasporus]KAJ8101775.1 major facilitator superfamily domain-containing protein [Lipomyces tetrasporus]